MTVILRQIPTICFAVLASIVVSISQSGAFDLNDPFNPKWEEDISPASGKPLGLFSGTEAIVSNAQIFAGVTGIVGDPSGFGFTVDLSGDYLFDFDKYNLKPEAQAALEEVMKLYAEYEGTNIVIEGHTDSKGSHQYNQKLSERRAKSVHDWFVGQGIASSLLTSSGLGERRPVASNIANEGRALNRRVEIKVTTTKKVNHLRFNEN